MYTDTGTDYNSHIMYINIITNKYIMKETFENTQHISI